LFQITDDILDVTASAADLGKTPGKDAQARKATYPALYGLDGARQLALAQCHQAEQALADTRRPLALLRDLALLTLTRRS
jgi:geranylgeranyl pyrophosphate synthase